MRVININEIDLSIYPFDFDLTMAIVLGNADGTVYHRYGGRSHLSPMSMEGLVDMMQKGLTTHREYQRDPSRPPVSDPVLLPDLVNEQLKGIMPSYVGCFHCHYAREALQLRDLRDGIWTPDKYWIFPNPERLGLVMDQTKQYQVKEVLENCPADFAGIKSGDLIQTLGGKRILSKYDIQWQLNECESGARQLPFSLLRNGKLVKGRLSLNSGWKVGNPNEYSWRTENSFTAHMIKFLPASGFLGEQLGGDELRSLNLRAGKFAIRVTKLNRGPFQAGIRLGDVVIGAGERTDFQSIRDFYAYCENMRRAGRDIKIQLHREGYELSMMISLNYMNYTRIEIAPQVETGFIAQQLSGSAGVRVGHVTDESRAELAGIRHGDRITALDHKPIGNRADFLALINQKAPGDLVKLDLLREGEPRRLSYFLPAKDEVKSDMARLSDKVERIAQKLTVTLSIDLPPGQSIHSVFKRGKGIPTQIEFRGTGYRLAGEIIEPEPKKSKYGDWIHDGKLDFKQEIIVTGPDKFYLIVEFNAQVCDATSCHPLRAVLRTEGDASFYEFQGDFEGQPKLTHHWLD